MHFVILEVHFEQCVVAFKTKLDLQINLDSNLFQNSGTKVQRYNKALSDVIDSKEKLTGSFKR